MSFKGMELVWDWLSDDDSQLTLIPDSGDYASIRNGAALSREARACTSNLQ